VLSIPWSRFGESTVVADAIRCMPSTTGASDWATDIKRIMMLVDTPSAVQAAMRLPEEFEEACGGDVEGEDLLATAEWH
jgi:hypothetical protein